MSKLEEYKMNLSYKETEEYPSSIRVGEEAAYDIGHSAGFVDGFDAAIALDLPVKFAKWLKNLDNGTEHYDYYTGKKSESISFSPSDCFEDDIMTVEELYQYWINNIYKPE